MVNLIHSDEFIFNNEFVFTDRYAGQDDYFSGNGKSIGKSLLRRILLPTYGLSMTENVLETRSR